MSYEVDHYRDAFDAARLGLTMADYQSGLTVAGDAEAYNFLKAGKEVQLGLTEVVITNETLTKVVGRPLVMLNRQSGGLSPAIVTQPDPTLPHIAQVTLFTSETFLPHKGLTPGQHFGLTAKAEANSSQFGGHDRPVVDEPGHFGSLMLGASNKAVEARLISRGDAATDAIIKDTNGGLIEQMVASSLVDLGQPRTRLVDFSKPGVRVQAFWHADTMQSAEGVPLKADHPASTEKLLGAGVLALGSSGVRAAKELVPLIIGGR